MATLITATPDYEQSNLSSWSNASDKKIVVGYVADNSTGTYYNYIGLLTITIPSTLNNHTVTNFRVKCPTSGSYAAGITAKLSTSAVAPNAYDSAAAIATSTAKRLLDNGSLAEYESGYKTYDVYFNFSINRQVKTGDKYYVYIYAPAFNSTSYRLFGAMSAYEVEATSSLPTYKITLNKGTGIASVSGAGTYTVDTQVEISAQVATGYSWNGWSDGDNSNPRTLTITGDKTLTAQATINSYTLTINPNGGSWGGKTSNSTITQNYGTNKTIDNPTRSMYTFTNWVLTGQGSLSGSTYTYGAGNGTLTAQWTPNTYQVSYNANGGTGAPQNQSFVYNSGACISTQVPSRAGYRFLYWDCNGTHFNPGAAIPTGWGSFTLVAQWEENEYEIKYLPGKYGAVDAPSLSQTKRGSVDIHLGGNSYKQFYRTGYHHIGWTTIDGGSKEYDFEEIYTEDAAIILYPAWEPNKYTIHYDEFGEGSYDRQIHTYDQSQNLLGGITKQGYKFKGWGSLPKGYKKLEYIESTGTQYIDTGIILRNREGGPFEFDVTFMSQGSDASDGFGNVFGVRSSSGVNEYQLSLYENGMISLGRRQTNLDMRPGTKYNVIYGKGLQFNHAVINNRIVSISLDQDFDLRDSLVLFGIKDGGNITQLSKTRLYSLTLLNINGEVLHKFIPCIYPDGEVGLFDIITQSTYSNDGEGEFIAGPIVDSIYEEGEEVINLDTNNNSIISLYALWELLGLVYIDNGTQFEAYQMFIDNGTSWDQVIPYMDNGTEWSSLL